MGKISNYARALVAKLQDVFVVDQTDNNVTTTKSVTVEQIGDTIAGTQTHSTLNTSSKTLIGAINEVAKDKNVADEYDSTHTYNTGDITIHDNTLYICQDDSVTGAWDSTKWSATTVDDLIPKTDNNLPHYTGTPTAGTTAYEIEGVKTTLDEQTDTTNPLFKVVVFPNSASKSIGAGGVIGLSANDMNISTPTGYTPIGIVSFYANNNDIFFRSVAAQATGTSTFAVVHNVGAAANVIFNAIILYAKTAYVKQISG